MILGGGSSCQSCGCGPIAAQCAARDYTPVGYESVYYQDYQSGGAWVASSDWGLCQMFATTAGAITLTSATLAIAGYSPLQTTGVGSSTYRNYPQCWIHAVDATSGFECVGAALSQLTGPLDINDSEWVFEHGGYSLAADTRYWIVLRRNGSWQYHTLPSTFSPLGCYPYGDGLKCCALEYMDWDFITNQPGINTPCQAAGATTDVPYILRINGEDLSWPSAAR